MKGKCNVHYVCTILTVKQHSACVCDVIIQMKTALGYLWLFASLWREKLLRLLLLLLLLKAHLRVIVTVEMMASSFIA